MSDDIELPDGPLRFVSANQLDDLRVERDRYRQALLDIADVRTDGKTPDFHFFGRAEDRERAMMARALEALDDTSK